ncbi:hypothetical protein VKT23_007934 [Stygiomarasmius scandens]|uniref:Uncharacterized protein n=1 Tax=Marasmiellus scandens TaxID=2682957 RepID=A0ABR1JIT2_9AGAR
MAGEWVATSISGRKASDAFQRVQQQVALVREEMSSKHVLLDWSFQFWTGARVTVSPADSPSDREGHDLVDCFFGSSKHIISAFDSLRTSPILKDFSWSPRLVLSAIPRNFTVLHPPTSTTNPTTLPSKALSRFIFAEATFSDTVSTYSNGVSCMNTYSGIPDFFDLEGYLRHHSEAEEKELRDHEKGRILKPYYFKHRLPEVDQIVHRLRSVQEENPSLDLNKVYVLSNGKASWLNELAGALKSDGWGDVKSTLDLRLDSQQKYVSGAIDMAIAEKAEVFIGNGVSVF